MFLIDQTPCICFLLQCKNSTLKQYMTNHDLVLHQHKSPSNGKTKQR